MLMLLAGKDAERVRQLEDQYKALVGPRCQLESDNALAWLTSHGLQAAVSALPLLASLKPIWVVSVQTMCDAAASS